MFSAGDLLWIDFEVASAVDLKAVGTVRYAADASTHAIVLAYAIGDAPALTWHAHGAILDWDNAQIAPQELDFVKLAHWSTIGKDGYFEPHPAIFSSFCEGYGVRDEAIKQSAIFRLAEILWLFRVHEFAGRTPAAKPFWPASRYASLLAGRLKSLYSAHAVRGGAYAIAPKSRP